jgi:hypothetical protein
MGTSAYRMGTSAYRMGTSAYRMETFVFSAFLPFYRMKMYLLPMET